jgi:hypothetical protein
MESGIREVVRTHLLDNHPAITEHLKKLKWGSLRLMFIACTVFGTTTIIGGFLFFPVFSYCFFGNFRFWRYLRVWPRLLAYAYYFSYISLKGELVLSVSFTAPPMSEPKLNPIQINPAWLHGKSCGNCSKCCRKIKCPLLDKASDRCMSYNSFFWRYFNCGRYPESQSEIERYECPKWVEMS